MKKLLIIFAIAFGMITNAYSQVKETFDSNTWQWTEFATKKGSAYIIDGVMRLVSNSTNYGEISLEKMVENNATHSFLPMDPVKGFDLKCTATLKNFYRNKVFGIILDYIDDKNCLIFMIQNDFAWLLKMKEGQVVGQQRNQFKFQRGRIFTNLDIEVIYNGGELEFRVNDVQALMCKYVPITSNGFGFIAYRRCKVDIDDIEIIN